MAMPGSASSPACGSLASSAVPKPRSSGSSTRSSAEPAAASLGYRHFRADSSLVAIDAVNLNLG